MRIVFPSSLASIITNFEDPSPKALAVSILIMYSEPKSVWAPSEEDKRTVLAEASPVRQSLRVVTPVSPLV